MATASNDIDDLRRQMAAIRRELHEDVRDVVASAEAVTDWHRYIKKYPWVALGAAFAVGYVIVPKRRRATHADVAEVREAVAQAQEQLKEEPTENTEKVVKKGLLASAMGIVGPFVLRAARNYAMQYVEGWIAQQQQAMMVAAGPPPPPSPRAPGSPGAGRTRGPAGI